VYVSIGSRFSCLFLRWMGLLDSGLVSALAVESRGGNPRDFPRLGGEFPRAMVSRFVGLGGHGANQRRVNTDSPLFHLTMLSRQRESVSAPRQRAGPTGSRGAGE
jgi:hypothetical protein